MKEKRSFSSTEKDTDKLSWSRNWNRRKPTALGWQEAGGWRPGAAEGRYPPLLAVLPHAHPGPRPRGVGLLQWSLPHLEADPTRGAAGRPRGPGGPASGSCGKKQQGHWGQLAECLTNLYLHLPPCLSGTPHGDHWRDGLRRPREQGALGSNAMYCLEPVTLKSIPAPRTWLSKENLRVKFYMYLQIT